jgi:hypothetical protein
MAGPARETYEFKPRLTAKLSTMLLMGVALIALLTVAMFALSPNLLPIFKRAIHTRKFWLAFLHDPRMYVGPIAVAGALVWLHLRNKYVTINAIIAISRANTESLGALERR